MNTARKYAPKHLNEVIYANDALKWRIDLIATGKLDRHLLLWGPNGSGKSTVADLLPSAIAGPNASIENEGFDQLLSRKDLKNYLQNSCSFGRMAGSSKYFLIMHEFDNTKVNAYKLWTAMDECENDLMVIITTNNAMNVHKSIRSRCDEIKFPQLTARQFLARAQEILDAEGVSLPDYQVLYYLQQVEKIEGDLRKYCAQLDELIAIANSGHPLPPVPPASPGSPAAQVPVLTVVSNGNP